MSIKLLVEKKKEQRHTQTRTELCPQRPMGAEDSGDKSNPRAAHLHHKHQSGQFSRFLGFTAEGFLKGRERKKKPNSNKTTSK